MTISIGTFIKTNAPQLVEIVGTCELDFAIVDAEHAPFDRTSLDLMLLAGRAANLPLFVRIPDALPPTILQALDMGAAGLVVPHVDTAQEAATIVRRARFHDGERGFSNSARFGRYGGTTIMEAVALGDSAQIICQIESEQGVANAEAIAATPGVDGLLVGRADLALSMGLRSLDAEQVFSSARSALAAARRHGKIAAIAVGQTTEISAWAEAGATMFVVGSEQSLMRGAAKAVAEQAREILKKLQTDRPKCG